MDGIGFVLLLLLAVFLIIGLPIFFSIFGYKWFRKRGYNKIAIAIPTLIIGTAFYFIYTAFYPTDDFYIQNFEENTAITFPASGVILKKDADYPDHHGDYTSKAIIRFSPQDYKAVYQQLTADTLFRVDTSSYHFLGDTKEFFHADNIEVNQINPILIGGRKAQFKVGFVKDGKTVVFERHSS